MEEDERSGGVSRRRRPSWRVGSPAGRGHKWIFPLLVMPSVTPCSTDMWGRCQHGFAGKRGFPGLWGVGHTGLLSFWNGEPWATQLGQTVACAASVVFSMLAEQSLGICRSDGNLNKAQMFLSASQRIRAVESVLHCCDCKAGCSDEEGLVSWSSYSLRIQLENIYPGGCLCFRCVTVALG